MKVRIIPRGQSLIDEIMPLLAGDGHDFSGSMVVFPGRRPAHFLRKRLGETEEACLIPPVIFSMDGFVDDAFGRIETRQKLEPIDAVSLLYDIHRSSPHTIGGGQFLTLDRFFPLGMKIFRDLEELLIEDADVAAVRGIDQLAAGAIPDDSLRRMQTLSYFYDRFHAEADRLGYATRSMRYRAVAQRVAETGLGRFRQRIFAGFFALTDAEQMLFRALEEDDGALFIFQAGRGLGEKLASLGITAELPPAATGPAVQIYSSPDTHGQVYGLRNLLSSLPSPDERTAVVLPSSEALFPLIREGLPSVGRGDYNISMGYPLARTPIYGFLTSLMELAGSMDNDRVYIPAYLDFVLHPYTKNILYRGSAEATRILFHCIEEELIGQGTKMFMTLTEIEGNETLMRAAADRLLRAGGTADGADMRTHLETIHRNTIGRFASFSSVGDCARQCAGLLTYIYENSSARLHPLFHPFSETFLDMLDTLAASRLAALSFADRSGYFSLLKRQIANERVPFDGTPVKGLQVLGFLETRGLRFDRVFILDVNEEVLPDPGGGETLLPHRARQLLGLPTYRDRDALSAYYFDVLIGSAGEVHLFYAESDAKERSRFVERLIWDMQQRDREQDERSYVTPVQYRLTLASSVPVPVEKSSAASQRIREKTFSVTALDTYLRCPLSFYYGHVLDLDRKEGVTGEIARTDIGVTVHEILHDYFSETVGRMLTPSDIDSGRMEELINRHFRRAYGTDLSGAAYLLQRQVKKQMASVLERYYRPLIEEGPVTVRACEHRVYGTVEGLRLKGRIDSIEQRGSLTCLVDFKTGSSGRSLGIDTGRLDPADRETWSAAVGSLQLPLYCMLYAETERLEPDGLDAFYLLLGKSRIDRGIEQRPLGSPGEGSGHELVKTVARSLLREIGDQAVPFYPARDLRRACPGCNFREICGTRWVLRG